MFCHLPYSLSCRKCIFLWLIQHFHVFHFHDRKSKTPWWKLHFEPHWFRPNHTFSSENRKLWWSAIYQFTQHQWSEPDLTDLTETYLDVEDRKIQQVVTNSRLTDSRPNILNYSILQLLTFHKNNVMSHIGDWWQEFTGRQICVYCN